MNQNILKASLLALIAFFFQALFGIFTKVAIVKLESVIWVSFIAYFVSTFFLSLWILPKGISYLKSQQLPSLIGRATFGTISSFLYTISIHFIPLVNATLLFNAAPIFIPIFAILFWRAHIQTAVWLAVLMGFVGIIAIIKPTAAIFYDAGNLIGLTSGMTLAIAYLLMKSLTKTEPGLRIIYYYLGLGMLMQVPLLFFTTLTFSYEGLIYASISGLLLLSAQIALVNAYRFAEASQVGIYQYSTVVYVGLFEWLYWNNVPSTSEIIGFILVAFAGMIIIYSNHIKLKNV